jgi:hypothetical protein
MLRAIFYLGGHREHRGIARDAISAQVFERRVRCVTPRPPRSKLCDFCVTSVVKPAIRPLRPAATSALKNLRFLTRRGRIPDKSHGKT